MWRLHRCYRSGPHLNLMAKVARDLTIGVVCDTPAMTSTEKGGGGATNASHLMGGVVVECRMGALEPTTGTMSVSGFPPINDWAHRLIAILLLISGCRTG